MVSVFVAEQKGIEPDFVGGDRSKGETAESSFVAGAELPLGRRNQLANRK